MGAEETKKTDAFSVKLFFAVLGIIAAYQVAQYLRGEPEWEEFTYEPGAFSVRLAGKPKLRVLSEEYAFGRVEFQYITCERREVQYAVAYGDVPEEEAGKRGAAALIDAARDTLLKKVQGEIAEERAASLDGHPGRAMRIRADDQSLLELRSFLVGRRLYRLLAAGPAQRLEGNAEVEAFFASFKVQGERAGPAP